MMGIISIGIITYYAYIDKLYSLVALYIGTLVILLVITMGMGYRANGEFAILVLVYTWCWFKSTPRCFNPFRCDIYKLKTI
jgi:hypothetical protein